MPSFLNTPVTKIKPNQFFLNESTKTSKRKLSKWGDVDMDGSPNKFDCNPFNPAEDGKVGDFIKNLSKKVKNVSKRVAKDVSKSVKPSLNIKTGNYSKQSLRNQKRFTGRALSTVRLLTPPGTVASTGKGKGKGKKGRPEGPSGKYFIPGVGAVGVYQYRTWLRQQKRVSRLKMMNGGGYNSQSQMQGESQQRFAPTEQVMIDEAAPAEQFNEMERISEPMQPTQIRPVGTDGMDYEKQMQLIMQQRDSILLAPQFLKGELKNAGGDILSDSGRPNILQAPNINLGQMRNLQARNPVELGERPITNPSGNYFTTIDPITGNPILQRRISEKWLDGRAI